MLGIEDVLCELATDHDEMNGHGMPPGFRFHPTDEELITFYLASKVLHGSLCSVDIAEVDLNKCEPWDLPDLAKMGKREWYFFSLRDRKYPTGLRTNRATGTGYWKATGKDKEIHNAATGVLIGMKKTLVFYLGRAPRGEKTKWVMHEYRLHGDFFYRAAAKEEWVICRIHHKASGDKKNMFSHEMSSQLEPAPTYYSTPSVKGDESFLPALTESQLNDGDFIHQNQTTKFSLFPSCNFSSGSWIGTSGMNPGTTALSSMLIKSLLSPLDQQQNHNLGRQFMTSTNNVAEQIMKTESASSFPLRKLLAAGAAADNLEWFHELQQASISHLDPFFSNTTGEKCSAISSNLGGAGCLQTMTDPSYKIPIGESSWALLDA